MNAVEVQRLSVTYQNQTVVDEVSFKAPRGKLIGIIGPNGAGKSSLIKGILGLVPHVVGDVKIFNKSYKEQCKQVGYVPQRESVDWDFPTHVLDVVTMGTYGTLSWFQRPGKKQKELAMSCLEKVGMDAYWNRQISQLSGGQQQRVFLARALAQKAEVYFMDEPFVGVDALTEKAIIRLLEELKNQGKTVFVVHHDLSTVKEYFDWLLMMNKRLYAFGPVDDVFTAECLEKTYNGKLSVFQGGK